MLRKCHGHGLTKGAIIQIFYHGLDELTQEILDGTAEGIFPYKSQNQAFQFLEDKVLFEHDWPIKSKNEHDQKFVSFADGSNKNNDNSRFMEKLKAMDSQLISLNKELQDPLLPIIVEDKPIKTTKRAITWSKQKNIHSEHYPYLDNGIYNVVDRVMRPLILKQTRKPQSDYGNAKACHSVSSSSTHHYGSSSHHGDDNEDDGISRASTPSSTSFLNSLSPLNYQKYDIPISSQQDNCLLFKRQTYLLNQTQKLHEEVRGGFKFFKKSLKGVFIKKKK
nr:reverse transcriptase domain-containing protein [Tanacetum cinerariifolium]